MNEWTSKKLNIPQCLFRRIHSTERKYFDINATLNRCRCRRCVSSSKIRLETESEFCEWFCFGEGSIVESGWLCSRVAWGHANELFRQNEQNSRLFQKYTHFELTLWLVSMGSKWWHFFVWLFAKIKDIFSRGAVEINVFRFV